jgi:flagellum-specific ATP synthase
MLDVTEQLETVMPTALSGSVARTEGMTISAAGFPAPVGAVAEIRRETGGPLLAEVIGFRDELTILYPFSDLAGVRHGNRVRLARTTRWLRVGNELLGRVIDAAGNSVDGRPRPALHERTSFSRRPPHPCRRPRIDQPLSTGVRSVDGLLTCGKGQRVGIFSGSGVGKSVLLGMMARYTSADVIVIALIGERGREVNEFIQRDLGPQGLAKSVVVVATSDEPALVRVQAASTATAIAEHFRDQGRDVLLLMDSLTRYAYAQREIGLAAGEPPTTRGYPPSVFALMPKLVERAGRSPRGSITAFYTVLVEADDPAEPISDAVRGLLDGHLWLSRELASRGQYPAVDVLESLSRLMPEITDQPQQQAARVVRELLAAHRSHEDLISVGAYRRGSNKTVDVALEMMEEITAYLRQPVEQSANLEEARQGLMQLNENYQRHLQAAPAASPSPGTLPQGAAGQAPQNTTSSAAAGNPQPPNRPA